MNLSQSERFLKESKYLEIEATRHWAASHLAAFLEGCAPARSYEFISVDWLNINPEILSSLELNPTFVALQNQYINVGGQIDDNWEDTPVPPIGAGQGTIYKELINRRHRPSGFRASLVVAVILSAIAGGTVGWFMPQIMGERCRTGGEENVIIN
jgi:hypothetical protein